MNQRIRELAEQAVQLVANEHTKGDVSRLNTDAYHVKDLINVKFAELIVKECAGVAKQSEPDDGDDYKSGRVWAGIDILKHFNVGVEE